MSRVVDVSCSWLVLHSQQSQSVSSSSPSHLPRGSRNWRAIKEALKRGNCQHDCLRFLAVKEWKYRSGAIRTEWTALEIHLTVCCVLQLEIGWDVSEANTVIENLKCFPQTKDNKNNMSHIQKIWIGRPTCDCFSTEHRDKAVSKLSLYSSYKSIYKEYFYDIIIS